MSKTFIYSLRFPKNICAKQFHTQAILYKDVTFGKTEQVLKEQWEEKMKFWLRKYEDLFGLTKLSEMHERVLEVQKSIQTIQEKRRKVQEEIFVVQKKLQETHELLHKTSMGDNMYISFVTQVHELLKEQKRIQDLFSLYDQTEKEQQTTLALAINNSQDHERTYREKNKYLSLITGVVGGLIGLIGSSINNWRHRKDIKVFAGDISDQVTGLRENVDKLNSVVASRRDSVNERGETEMQNFLSDMKTQQEIFQNNVQTLQSLVNDNVSVYEINNGFYLDIPMKRLFNQFEDNIDSKLYYHTSLNIGVISLLLVGISVLFFGSR